MSKHWETVYREHGQMTKINRYTNRRLLLRANVEAGSF